jgi:hypothetical protein
MWSEHEPARFRNVASNYPTWTKEIKHKSRDSANLQVSDTYDAGGIFLKKIKPCRSSRKPANIAQTRDVVEYQDHLMFDSNVLVIIANKLLGKDPPFFSRRHTSDYS